MAISTSQLMLAKERQTVADKLAEQTEELQDTPWWHTAGSIALPLLATALMPGVGTALAGLGGLGTSLGGLLTSGAGAGAGLGKTLGGIGVKSLYNLLASAGTKGALDVIGGKSGKDIGKDLTGLQTLLGKGAVKQLRKDYSKSQDQAYKSLIAGSIMSGLAQQGGIGALKKAGKVSFPGQAPEAFSGIPTTVDAAQQGLTTADIMGRKPGGFQQVMGGEKLITDPTVFADPYASITEGLIDPYSTQQYQFSQSPSFLNYLSKLGVDESVAYGEDPMYDIMAQAYSKEGLLR